MLHESPSRCALGRRALAVLARTIVDFEKHTRMRCKSLCLRVHCDEASEFIGAQHFEEVVQLPGSCVHELLHDFGPQASEAREHNRPISPTENSVAKGHRNDCVLDFCQIPTSIWQKSRKQSFLWPLAKLFSVGLIGRLCSLVSLACGPKSGRSSWTQEPGSWKISSKCCAPVNSLAPSQCTRKHTDLHLIRGCFSISTIVRASTASALRPSAQRLGDS